MQTNFNRVYRLTAKTATSSFSCGEINETHREALRVKFLIQKAEINSPNTSRIILWNLSPLQLSVLNERDCQLTLEVGYGSNLFLIFKGEVFYAKTEIDKGDRKTTIMAIDGRIALRDTWVSLTYMGKINTKIVIKEVARQMGIPVVFGYNLNFNIFPRKFTYLGKARGILNRACKLMGVTWSIQDGILQVKNKNDFITPEIAYLLNSQTGLIGTPQKIVLAAQSFGEIDLHGYDVEYLLNGAIGIDDYIYLESMTVQGNFRVHSIEIQGDSFEGEFKAKARVLEVS